MTDNLKKPSIFTNPVVLTVMALICCALWGSATPAIKTGYNLLKVSGVPSIILFAGVRFFLAGILTVIIFSIARKRFLYPQKKNLGKVLKVSAFQTVIQYILFYLGLAYTSGVKGTVSSGTNAFFSLLIAALIFKQEKLTFKKILACVMGFSGIIIINLNNANSAKYADLRCGKTASVRLAHGLLHIVKQIFYSFCDLTFLYFSATLS